MRIILSMSFRFKHNNTGIDNHIEFDIFPALFFSSTILIP